MPRITEMWNDAKTGTKIYISSIFFLVIKCWDEVLCSFLLEAATRNA